MQDASFVTGKYPKRIMARLETCRRTLLPIFPMEMYTGHAALSPLKYDSFVLSEARMIGAIVPFLSGNES